MLEKSEVNKETEVKRPAAKNFLLIQFRQIGDVILTTPIPRILRQNFPDAEIDFLTFKVNESIWRYNPNISRLITFDRKSGFITFVKLLLQLRKNRYDAILDFQDTPRSTYCALAGGARYRVTWQNSSRSRLYNLRVPRSDSYPSAAKSNLLLPFLPDLNVAAMPPPRPEVFFSDVESKRVDTLLQSYGIAPDDFIVTMAPTHRREVRRWPLVFFYETARFLIRKYNAKVILSWGPGEQEYIQGGLAAGDFAHPSLITDLFLNLLELAALMKKAKFHFGNDSAPMHLATAQGLPTFSIFGATNTTWSYPSAENIHAAKGLDCQPCNRLRCLFGDEIPCLKSFEFKEIQPSLERFIQEVVLKR